MKSHNIKSLIKILPIVAIFVPDISQGLENTESPKGSADYYSSLIGVQNLAKQEQRLVSKLVRYKKKLTETLELIDYFLDDYSNSVHAIIKRHPQLREKFGPKKYPVFETEKDLNLIAEQISANPLMVFKLLRRFAVELIDIQLDTDKIQDHLVFKDFINGLGNTMTHPEAKDLNGAADGLLRLQETFQLPTKKMSQGVLLEKKTGCKLQAFDMQFIGARAISQERYATGLEWLYSAYEKVLKGDDSVPIDVMKGQLLMSRNLHNAELLKFNYNSANLFSNLVNSTFTNIPEMFIPPAIWEYKVGLKSDSWYDLYNYMALCRGEQLLSPNVSKRLHCWYSRSHSAFNIISPLKVEMHHKDPPVLQIYNLIPDSKINYIKETAHPLLKRSQIVGGGESDLRTSSVAWLPDLTSNDSVLIQIPRTVNEATGLECGSVKASEELQVSCYGSVGGYYIPHFDILADGSLNNSTETQKDLGRGDRVATVMFYLSDVELGGGTAFPRMGIAAQPIKGSAVFWYNLKLSGSEDRLSLHGGCPVLFGNKWVANKWIRLYEQMHVRKCALHRLA